MKKNILTFIVLCIVITTISKAQKGSILVAGDFSIKSTKQNNYSGSTDERKQTNFLISPTIGYQFNENWTVGFSMSFGSGKTDFLSYPQPTVYTQTQKENLFAIGPMIRYSKKISDIFTFYTQLNTLFGSDKFSTTYSGSTTTDDRKMDLTSITLTPAIYINLKNNFGLNISVGGLTYQELNYNNGNAAAGYNDTKNSGFEFTLGKTINIGISKNFVVK